MIKLIIKVLLLGTAVSAGEQPEVKVSGAMKNIMMNGDLSAHVNLDTLNKTHLYGLGPVPGLKGEIMILDGTVYTTAMDGIKLQNQQNKISQAAMLVYSNVEKWKTVSSKATVNSYADLEKLVEKTAKQNGYDTEIPFAFKIEASPEKASYHVIDWKEGVTHTMDNHKQFAYSGKLYNEKAVFLGFYSTHHQGIFTHHSTNMHIHILADKSKIAGHLDEVRISGLITIYLPEK